MLAFCNWVVAFARGAQSSGLLLTSSLIIEVQSHMSTNTNSFMDFQESRHLDPLVVFILDFPFVELFKCKQNTF